MDNVNTIIIFLISTPLLLLFLTSAFITLRIFIGKSINNSDYPPAKGTLFSLIFHFNHLHDYLTAIAAKHSTFRILLPAAKSYIHTTEPSNIEHILKNSFDKYSKGKSSRENMAELLGEGIFLADGEEWRRQRKLASFEFSTRVLRDFSCLVFRKNAAKLVRAVSAFCDVESQVFDMQELLMRYTLDSIFEVGFGVELNCMELESSSEEATEFMRAFDALNASVSLRFFDPIWKLKRFLHIGSEASLRRETKVIDDFVQKLILKKRKLLAVKGDFNNGKDDIISRFLVESEKDPDKMNDKYLRDVVLNFMIAGKDTTGGTLSWFFYMLCKHPLVQEKIVQEVRDVFGDKLGSGRANNNIISTTTISDFIDSITDSTLEKMHYLHAALSETLRLYPAVPMDGRCANVEDTLPNGFRVKKGDEVLYAAYAMGRMPYIWGEDAAEFRPERWLKNGVFQSQSPFKFIAFHAGPRTCLGKEFAYRQMKIVSIALLHFFRFKLSDETKDLTYKILLTLHMDGDLPLCAISRKNL